MARHNQVHLFGQVIGEPRFTVNKEGVANALFMVNVIRGARKTRNEIMDVIQYDSFLVKTAEPEIYEKIRGISTGDMVDVKGVLTSNNVKKSRICNAPTTENSLTDSDTCGFKLSSIGTIMFIAPTVLSVWEKGLTTDQGIALMKERGEICNEVVLIGNLTKDPQYYNPSTGIYCTTYQIAVDRKYFLKDGKTKDKTDYIYIRSFGEIARYDHKVLRVGSMVFVEGVLKYKKYVRHDVCPNCGAKIEWNDDSIEVLPYCVEPLKDYITEEERLAQKIDLASSVLT